MTAVDPTHLVVPPGHGEGTWHLDTLWNWKIPAAIAGGEFSLSEQLLPRGCGPTPSAGRGAGPGCSQTLVGRGSRVVSRVSRKCSIRWA